MHRFYMLNYYDLEPGMRDCSKALKKFDRSCNFRGELTTTTSCVPLNFLKY